MDPVVDFTMTVSGESNCSSAVFFHQRIDRPQKKHTCIVCGRSGRPPFTRFVIQSGSRLPEVLFVVYSCGECTPNMLERWSEVIQSLLPEMRLFEPIEDFFVVHAPRYGFPVEIGAKA